MGRRRGRDYRRSRAWRAGHERILFGECLRSRGVGPVHVVAGSLAEDRRPALVARDRPRGRPRIRDQTHHVHVAPGAWSRNRRDAGPAHAAEQMGDVRSAARRVARATQRDLAADEWIPIAGVLPSGGARQEPALSPARYADRAAAFHGRAHGACLDGRTDIPVDHDTGITLPRVDDCLRRLARPTRCVEAKPAGSPAGHVPRPDRGGICLARKPRPLAVTPGGRPVRGRRGMFARHAHSDWCVAARFAGTLHGLARHQHERRTRQEAAADSPATRRSHGLGGLRRSSGADLRAAAARRQGQHVDLCTELRTSRGCGRPRASVRTAARHLWTQHVLPLESTRRREQRCADCCWGATGRFGTHLPGRAARRNDVVCLLHDLAERDAHLSRTWTQSRHSAASGTRPDTTSDATRVHLLRACRGAGGELLGQPLQADQFPARSRPAEHDTDRHLPGRVLVAHRPTHPAR